MPGPLVLAGIGAGVGALSNLFSSNKPQETRQSLDPESQAYIRNMRNMASMFAGRSMPQLDPTFLAALERMGGYGQAGLQGVQAMTDPTAAAQFMNPFMSAMNPVFDRMRASAVNQFNKNATAAGAFGARRNLGQGQAMADINQAQGQFSYQGFNDAMTRALSLASMGMGANQWLGQAGQYMTDRQRNWDLGSLGMLQSGYGTPLYTTNTQPNDKPNMFQSMLGGAMTGLSFAGGPTGMTARGMRFGVDSLPGYGSDMG
jgi:hypothetical protein